MNLDVTSVSIWAKEYKKKKTKTKKKKKCQHYYIQPRLKHEIIIIMIILGATNISIYGMKYVLGSKVSGLTYKSRTKWKML